MLRNNFTNIVLLLVLLLFASNVSAQWHANQELVRISFVGNKYFSDGDLQEVIFSEETPWWLWQFLDSFSSFGKGAVYFNINDIKTDVNALKQFYQTNGFFQVRVTDSLDVLVDGIALYYLIDEGNVFTKDTVICNGIDEFTTPWAVTQIFEVDSTERFSEQVLANRINESIRFMRTYGFMQVNIDSTLIYKDTTHYSATVEIFFNLGERFAISDVKVDKSGDGSYGVSDKLLIDLVNIEKFSYYNIEKLQQSQIRLIRTGLFSTVSIQPITEEITQDTLVPLEIVGSIGSLNELGPEIIMNNQQNAFNFGLGLNYTRKNFFGRARKFDVGFSYVLQDVFSIDYAEIADLYVMEDTLVFGSGYGNVKVTQPNIFNLPVFGSVELYNEINKQRDFNYILYGTEVAFDFEMPDFTFINFLNTSYEVQYTMERNLDTDEEISIFIAGFGVEARSVKINDPIFPTSGYSLALILEEGNALPYLSSFTGLNDSEDLLLFYKSQVTLTTYLPLDKESSTFAAKARVGLIHDYKGDIGELPYYRSFYVGGSNSVRGWRARQLIPGGLNTITESSRLTSQQKGGTFLAEGSVSLRAKFTETMGVSIFTDFGNVWNGYDMFSFNDIAVASGFGFRYYTDFLSFRVDFGFKMIDPYSDRSFLDRSLDEIMEFHFGIGEAY